MNAVVTISPYTANQKNGQIVCNILFEDLLRDVQEITRAMARGQEDDVTHPDHIWPDSSIAWHCESAVVVVIRDLETLKGGTTELGELSSRIFQVESTLIVVRAAAPESAGYVCRCLDSAISLAGVAGRLILDCIATGKPEAAKIEPEVRNAARRANKEAVHA